MARRPRASTFAVVIILTLCWYRREQRDLQRYRGVLLKSLPYPQPDRLVRVF